MRKKSGTAMVVGAGIGGIRSALDLAGFGYRVILIDRAPSLGGILNQLDYQFPTDGCGMCKMLPHINRDISVQTCLRRGLFHDNIEILLSTEMTSIKGEPGNFRVTLQKKFSPVDPVRCTGCGECIEVCPVDVPDSFNMGMAKRKAIYKPVPHTAPGTFTIDLTACTRCGECLRQCSAQAIRLPEEKRKEFKILIVDDEFSVRDSLKEWLVDEGFFVDMAESGREALDKLVKTSFHLMLTDIKMPEMDGVELLEKAKEIFPDLPVVMMTAYATVETAVEAMKTGALDYLMKPFDPDTFLPKILQIYQGIDALEEEEIEVGAVVISTGTDYFNPADSVNTLGYGIYPDVYTSREFERILSGTGPGPSPGNIICRSDGKPAGKIVWIQCVGSRDLNVNADFCSSVCCMHALKEARLVKDKYGIQIETVIFYMDMRTFGKTYQCYLDEAQDHYDIRLERSKVHTVSEDSQEGGLTIRYTDFSGNIKTELVDIVILSVGQKPISNRHLLEETIGLSMNSSGFCEHKPFHSVLSNQEGILLAGSCTGLKDISETLIQAGSAALEASRVIHSAGGSLAPEHVVSQKMRDVSGELPQILIVICTCNNSWSEVTDQKQLAENLKTESSIRDVVFMDSLCMVHRRGDLARVIQESGANRILIASCLPNVLSGKPKVLSDESGIPAGLIDVIDLRTLTESLKKGTDKAKAGYILEREIRKGFSRLIRIEPPEIMLMKITKNALVVGGGIGGMTAALAIADHGYHVDLVEKDESLGGNLSWIGFTVEGYSVQSLFDETLLSLERHPLITVHTASEVTDSRGQPGYFSTTLHHKKENRPELIKHGITILATGGQEAGTSSYCYGKNPAILTQKELSQKLTEKSVQLENLKTVVMIQCVDSREKPRNYCSRVCCTASLKHALKLKNQNPEMDIYIFYRDIMTYGFSETWYTKARNLGVIFFHYDTDQKPVVSTGKTGVIVSAREHLLSRDIEIHADLVVLATGIIPTLSGSLARIFGVKKGLFGFFKEAEPKWRPLDCIKEGIFACGLTLSPRNITETIASAGASAERALAILGHETVSSGEVIARVHPSLCSLCERCIEACPYQARTLEQESHRIVVNPVICQGCGSCAVICPNSASVITGFSDQQFFDVIDAVLQT